MMVLTKIRLMKISKDFPLRTSRKMNLYLLCYQKKSFSIILLGWCIFLEKNPLSLVSLKESNKHKFTMLILKNTNDLEVARFCMVAIDTVQKVSILHNFALMHFGLPDPLFR